MIEERGETRGTRGRWGNVDVVYVKMSVVYGDCDGLVFCCGIIGEECVSDYFSEW